MMIRTMIVLASFMLLTLSGCAGTGPKGAAAFSSMSQSNAGNYQVRLNGPTDITAGEGFDLAVEIFTDPAATLPAGKVTIELNGRHEESGTVIPDNVAATMVSDGHFRFTHMVLEKPGVWDIFVDVTRGAITERAQVRVNINEMSKK